MALSSIKTDLFNRLESLVGLPDIYYSNIDAVEPDGEYIKPDILPINTVPVGMAATDKEAGLFQVLIYIEKGAGEIKAADYAAIILAGFSRNLSLANVRIESTGSVGAVFYSGGKQVTPVTINYLKIS